MVIKFSNLHLKNQKFNMIYPIVKRSCDVFFALFSIIILSPLLIPVIFILKFTGEGEIFYLQKRVGLQNKEFSIYKFATMLKNSPNIGDGIYTSKGDPRILPFGHFLRKSKINEIPQIFNILFGNMSIVGPRPLILETFDFYDANTKSVLKMLKPGLSGIGSIIFRNEEFILEKSIASKEDFYRKNISPYKGMLELWYSENISFYTDFIIILLTVWVIFRPKSQLVYKIFPNLPPRPDFLN